MSPFFQRKLFWGIRVWQLGAFLLFYLFFAFQYWLAIWYTSYDSQNRWREALLDYFVLKALLTLPLWRLYFITWKNKSLLFKICMHLVTGPLWILCWFYAYRWVQDWRGELYLTGKAIWWDIYIPGLVYFLQFAIFHVYDFYLQTQKQKQKEKELISAAYKSEVNALKARIHPHFLFNTLNSISASVPKEMEHVRELIAKLADTFRYSLRASEQELITLKDELTFIQTVLELEQERLKKRLKIIYDIDERSLHQKIPPMLLQPIVENAVKHGIAPSVDGGVITISIKQQDAFTKFIIKDTGAGKLNGNLFNKGVGLSNVNLRLEKLYGQKIDIEQNHPSGLIFSFLIPV